MIRSARDHFFKKRFSELDFLKTVSVTIIAENENEKIPSPYDLYIFSAIPILVSPTDFFKNCSPYPIFWIFNFPPLKRWWDWEGVKNYAYLSKTLSI